MASSADWLQRIVQDPVAMYASFAEHAAVITPPLLSKRLFDAMARMAASGTEPGLTASERLSRAYAGDREVAVQFPLFVSKFGKMFPKVLEAFLPTLVGNLDGARERFLSAVVFLAEGLIQLWNDMPDDLKRIERGDLTLADAVRVRAMARQALARGIANATAPSEPVGAWTVEDEICTLTVPLWPRFEPLPVRDAAATELERRRYRRQIETRYRMPATDRALVSAFYRQWAEHQGWPVDVRTDFGLDIVDITPKREPGEHGFSFWVAIAEDETTIAMYWQAPETTEHTSRRKPGAS